MLGGFSVPPPRPRRPVTARLAAGSSPSGLIETPTSPEALEFPPPPDVAPEAASEVPPVAVAARPPRSLSRAPLMVGAVIAMAALVGLVFLNTPPRPAPTVMIPPPPLSVAPAGPEPVVAPAATPPAESLAAPTPTPGVAPPPPRRSPRMRGATRPKPETVPLAPASAPVVAVPVPLPPAPSPAKEMLLRPAIRPPTDPEAPVPTRARTPD
jgi:hypothetical protein